VEVLIFDTGALTRLAFGFPAGVGEPDSSVQALDLAGVGQLIEGAVRNVRAIRHEVSLGLIGDAVADLATLRFGRRLGFDFVGCAPAHLLKARLAAAQVAIRNRPDVRK
jgi:pyruvate,orthophosphate dikinase